jgi:two-component system OmpR family sensor kinase
LYSGEKKSVLYVLGLYLSSTLILIIVLFASYYFHEKSQIELSEKEILRSYTLEIQKALLNLSDESNNDYKYPRFENFKSAIYDIDQNLIFSTMDVIIDNFSKEYFSDEKYSYLITPIKPYFLGTAYIIVQKQKKDIFSLSKLLFLASISIIVTVITSYFLVNLLLKPLRENIKLLDNFIKDTTHELNTPITTILANIESLDTSKCDEKSLKKLQRIKIASNSISNLYEDLAYLLLNHKTSLQNQDLNLSDLLKQRVEYFLYISSLKNLKFVLDIEKDIIFFGDKKKLERLMDNLLSNAIKYTNKSTSIHITLNSTSLSIRDEGVGMSQDELKDIFIRYKRFDKTQGGFGLGYSIIKSIADEYNIKIDITSQLNQGTKVTLSW